MSDDDADHSGPHSGLDDAPAGLDDRYVRQVLDVVEGVGFVVDSGGRLRAWNGRLAETVARDTDALAGLAVGELFLAADREAVTDGVDRALDAGEATAVAALETDDGPVTHDLRLTRLTASDGSSAGVVGVTRHVTEKKAYERAIERENERLERLTNVISHDLRNPLTVAQARRELLEDGVDSEHLDTLGDALDRMETIIDDVLTLARQGKTVDEPESVALSATARRAWTTTATADATLDVGADAQFLADESRLVELFENLFRNSVDHGGTDVLVRVEATDGGFAVCDDGPGIPPENRPEVFEPGYTTARSGTGFGLAIVREIATAHGWTVSVTDGPDGGACFEFTGVEFAD